MCFFPQQNVIYFTVLPCCAVLWVMTCRNALEDADKLHAEGLLYKLWNAEFKYDVFFPAAQALVEDSAELVDLVDTYLKTEVSQGPALGLR